MDTKHGTAKDRNMEAEGASSLDVSQLSLGPEEQVQGNRPPDDPLDANKKRRKKQKNKCTLQMLASTTTLPSQRCLETHFPWKIVTRPERGRCAIAKRGIKAGELVISEQALAFVIRSEYRSAACHACCRDLSDTSPGVECTFCKFTMFCKQCKQKAIPVHKECCPIVNAISGIAAQADCDPDLLGLVLLLALRRTSAGEKPNEVLSGGSAEVGINNGGRIQPSFQDAMALQTHRDKISVAWKSSVRKGCEGLFDLTSKQVAGFRSNTEDLEFLAALINANAHGMGAQGLHNTDLAIGIFPFVSMLNHSCRPNCCFYSEGNVMHVRATEDVSQDTELCVSYINLYESRSTRRHQLAMTKHFDCGCPRCMEPLSSSIDRYLEGVVCNVKGCGGVLVKNPQETSADQAFAKWECDLCSNILATNTLESRPVIERPWNLVEYANERLCAAVAIYKGRHFKDARKMFEDFISEFTGKLHPLHVLLFDALTPLMNCCRVLGDAEAGIKACRNIIACLEKVLNGQSLELANFYFCLGEMCSERADAVDISTVLAKRYKKQAQEAFHRVRHIRKVCLGRPSLPI